MGSQMCWPSNLAHTVWRFAWGAVCSIPSISSLEKEQGEKYGCRTVGRHNDAMGRPYSGARDLLRLHSQDCLQLGQLREQSIRVLSKPKVC